VPRLDGTEEQDDAEPRAQALRRPSDVVSVFQGDALKLDEATRITERYDAKVVVLVGDKDVGKTTLIAETHHAFLAGPLAGHRFAESMTLPGFERRCFQARTRSRRETADTFRTSLSTGVRLFHLAVRSDTLFTATQHLLIADVSGEAFKSMRHRSEEVDKFAPFLQRAHCVTMLVSGWRLASGKHAQHARATSRTLLNVLLERQALSSSSIVQYVVTKWDCVVRGQAVAAANALLGEVQSQYSGRLRDLTCHQVATRGGADVGLAPRFGLEGLFGAWASQRPPDESTPGKRQILPENARSYLRYEGVSR
jgi:Double-GTPase 2